jgi:hypothetical protein
MNNLNIGVKLILGFCLCSLLFFFDRIVYLLVLYRNCEVMIEHKNYISYSIILLQQSILHLFQFIVAVNAMIGNCHPRAI